MKKQILGILIILSLGAFSWAQGSKDPFDVKKSQEELEIMKGILNTTISFLDRNKSQGEISPWRNPRIDAYYLADQGAVFVIPISSSPSLNLEFSRALDATRESLNELQQNLKFDTLYDGTLIAPALPALPAPPAPPALPALELDDGSLVIPAPDNQSESSVASKEELKKQLALAEEARAKAEKNPARGIQGEGGKKS